MRIGELFKKAYNMTFASSIICFFLGLLIFARADLAVKMVSIVFGIVFIILGIIVIINYFDDGALRLLFGYSVLYGVVDIIAGIAMLINPKIIYIIISLFVAVNLLIEFVSKMQMSLIMKKYEIDGWFFQIIISIVLLLCAIIVIINPAQGTIVIARVVAGIIMIVSVLNLVDCLIIKDKIKNLKKTIKDIL